MVVSQRKGTPIENIIILIMGTPKKGLLILGKPHVAPMDSGGLVLVYWLKGVVVGGYRGLRWFKVWGFQVKGYAGLYYDGVLYSFISDKLRQNKFLNVGLSEAS